MLPPDRLKEGTVHPVTDNLDPEGQMRYSSTLSLTSALDGVGGQNHAWHVYPLEIDQVPTV
jgi:hypothetical protein